MSSSIIAVFLIVLGLVLLWKGADWLVDGASSIARKFGVPPLLIGLTIVALGTSLPELVVAIMAATRGNSTIAIGSVLGGNIANVLLILGLTVMAKVIPIKRDTVRVDMPIAIVTTMLLLVLTVGGAFSRLDGLLCTICFVIFLAFTIISGKIQMMKKKIYAARKGMTARRKKNLIVSVSKSLVLVLGGLVMLIVGGQLTVNSATTIAWTLGLSETIIGLTVVGVGVCLPEFVVSIIGAIRGENDIVIGNIVGTHIFNLLGIFGVTSIAAPITIDPEFRFDLLVNLLAVVLLFGFAMTGKKRYALEKWEGGLLVGAYLLYLLVIVNRELHLLG